MDGELGAFVRAAIAKAGLYAFDKMWDNGYRQITSSTHPINTPDDLKGFKIRVPVSPLWTSMFKAFGASPTSINFSEVYSALQTKIVEGQENPLSLIQIAKLYEVQKYVLAHQPHVGRLLDARQQRRLGGAAQGSAGRSSTRNLNAAALAGARRHRASSTPRVAGRRSRQKGMVFNKHRPAGLPRRAEARPASTPSGRRNTAPRPGRVLEKPRSARCS